jgi:transcriptional regulator with XRE-family HTH domain
VVIVMPDFVQVASIADRLREAMNIRNKKQVDLERETGINRSAISRYLSGEYEPKNKPIYELAKALDVSEQWLMGYDVPMDRPKAQKNNDAISDIVVKLRSDEEFLSIVDKISKMDSEKRKSLNAFLD